MNRAFSACGSSSFHESLGRCPKLAIETALSAQQSSGALPTFATANPFRLPDDPDGASRAIHVFSAKGAVSSVAWGNAPGFVE